MGRVRGGRVGDDGQTRVGGDLQGAVVEVEVADRGVMEELASTAVALDVVRVPPPGELGAVGDEFVDEVGQVGVGRGTGGIGAQAPGGVVGDARPVAVEVSGARVEEDEAGEVRQLVLGVEGLVLRGAGELVGGEDVEMGAADEGGGAGQGVEDLLDAVTHVHDPAVAFGGPVGGADGTDEGGQVGALDAVELERRGQAVEDLRGDGAHVAALRRV